MNYGDLTCKHERLAFGSGGFYIFCSNGCGRSWVARKFAAIQDTELGYDAAQQLSNSDVRVSQSQVEALSECHAALKIALPYLDALANKFSDVPNSPEIIHLHENIVRLRMAIEASKPL